MPRCGWHVSWMGHGGDEARSRHWRNSRWTGHGFVHFSVLGHFQYYQRDFVRPAGLAGIDQGEAERGGLLLAGHYPMVASRILGGGGGVRRIRTTRAASPAKLGRAGSNIRDGWKNERNWYESRSGDCMRPDDPRACGRTCVGGATGRADDHAAVIARLRDANAYLANRATLPRWSGRRRGARANRLARASLEVAHPLHLKSGASR